MVVPQGMSYANLAGLPNVYGLYGAFVPPMVYALLGSSRQLAVGPVAVTSILLGNGMPAIMDSLGLPLNDNPSNPDHPEAQATYDRIVVQIAFLAGCFYTGIGLLRLGWITNFLSHSVISGFMTGASVQIAMSQVKYILGIKVGRSNPISQQLSDIFGALDGFQWREFVMGMAFITILLALRWAGKRYRRLVLLRAVGPLTVCVLSIAIMNIWKLYCEPSVAKPYIKSIGAIPKGMPAFTATWWAPLYAGGRQFSLAILICMIDLCESISIAKALAVTNKYQLNATQELRGLGFANLAGAMFNCYTTTGSFSRSAVNNAVGAATPLANFVTGLVVMLVLLFLTPVFEHMSQNTQGAIVIVGVLQLFDYEECIYLFRVSFLDWCVWVVAFMVVVFVSVEWGIAASVILSLVIVVFRSAFPTIQQLGRIPGTLFYRPVRQYRHAEAPPGYAIISVSSPIYFANIESVRDRVLEEVDTHTRAYGTGTDRLRFVILDLSSSPTFDATAVHFINDFLDELTRDGATLVLANPSRQVVSILRAARLVPKIGAANIQVDVAEAVAYVEAAIKELTALESA